MFYQNGQSPDIRCHVSGIPAAKFCAIGLPRQIPFVSSREFVSYQAKYTLERRPHPFFFTIPSAQKGGVADPVGEVGISCAVRDPHSVGCLDEKAWSWWDISMPSQNEIFDSTYGWLGVRPVKENFSCLIVDSEEEEGEAGGHPRLSEPFVLYK